MNVNGSFARAITNGFLRRVQSLIDDGSVDVNESLWAGGPPPLVHAASASRSDMVQLLLDAGARIDGVDGNGQTACHVAANLDDVSVLGVLLRHRPNLELLDEFGNTPLEIAAVFCRWTVMAMLVEAGASLDGACQSRLHSFAIALTG